MLPLTTKEIKLDQDATEYYIREKRLLKKFANDEDNCHFTSRYRGAVHSISNLKFNVPKEIPVVFISVQTMIIILL